VKKEAMNGLERSEVPEWPLTFTHNRAAFFYFASHAESLLAGVIHAGRD